MQAIAQTKFCNASPRRFQLPSMLRFRVQIQGERRTRGESSESFTTLHPYCKRITVLIDDEQSRRFSANTSVYWSMDRLVPRQGPGSNTHPFKTEQQLPNCIYCSFHRIRRK